MPDSLVAIESGPINHIDRLVTMFSLAQSSMAAALLTGITLLSPVAAAPPAKPNIVFILADDLGYTDVACYGSRYYETPNIDRLAAQGVKFLSHHHCPNCAPTRAALMSGQYAPRTGIYTVGSTDRFDTTQRPLVPVENVTKLPQDRAIFAKQLQSAGYTTGIFGKWHLGEDAGFYPGQRGFSEALTSAGAHFNFQTNPKTEHAKETYLADFLTDKAVDFIQRNKAQPFFLYLPHYGVHAPHDAKPEWIAHFKDKPGIAGHDSPVYAAMIASVDESVGRILQALDDLKLTDNTLVIFASDNGGVGGYQREGIKKGNDITDNAPLRSGKGSMYEGGTRVPLIARWPAVTTAGAICNVPTVHVDIYPTLIELAGATAPAHPLDGESLVPLLKNSSASLKRDAIYSHFPGYLGAGTNQWRTTPATAIQQGDWKLLEYLEDGHLELYNLQDDLGETKNLATKEPERAAAMFAKLKAWRTEIQAPMPTLRAEAKGTPPDAEPAKKKKGGKKKQQQKADSDD